MDTQLDYQAYHKQLLLQLSTKAAELLHSNAFAEENHQQIADSLASLVQTDVSDEFYTIGQTCLCKMIAAWPQLTPHASRDLFWFFGGDCLQYMPDEEIDRYQKLDEARYEAESSGKALEYAKLRQQIFGLH